MSATRRKVAVVGDAMVGKTALLLVFTAGTSAKEDIPEELETAEIEMEINGEPTTLLLWDASIRADFTRTRLRPFAYLGAHCVVICFSIGNPDSFDNVRERWLPEMLHYCEQKPPIILVGCQKDLRYDEPIMESLRRWGQTPVTFEQGEAVAQSIGAHAYVECSAKTGSGVREVFLRVSEAVKDFQIPKPARRHSLIPAPTAILSVINSGARHGASSMNEGRAPRPYRITLVLEWKENHAE